MGMDLSKEKTKPPKRENGQTEKKKARVKKQTKTEMSTQDIGKEGKRMVKAN